MTKESTKHHNDGKKSKALTDEPHPKDRESGTGRGKELRKDGGGKSNWGNYKDDLKEEKYEVVNPVEDKPEVPKVEEKVVMTLAEYYESKGLVLKFKYHRPSILPINKKAKKPER